MRNLVLSSLVMQNGTIDNKEFFFFFFSATPMAYGSFQARDCIQARAPTYATAAETLDN